MAGIVPNVPGTGNKVPVSSYIAGISELFPNVNRRRIIESSINSKERLDFTPSNNSVNRILTDSYIEFRINGITGSFLDLSSIALELCITVARAGVRLADDVHIALVNGISNTLFKSVSVFLNEKLVESCPVFNYQSYIKMLKSVKTSALPTVGISGFFHDDFNVTHGVTQTYTAASFGQLSRWESRVLSSIKAGGIHTYFPLLIDLASIDMYLLDSVDLRIRLEMANNNWVMGAHTDGHLNDLNIEKAKLWIDRVTPHYNAMSALNTALAVNPIQYIFDKTLYKTYVIGQNEDSILIDQPFNTCIPEKITLAMISMQTFSGNYAANSLYFGAYDLNNVHITVNGNTVYHINCNFPNTITQLYYETQKSIGGGHDNLITYNSFKNGRAIYCFSFVTEEVEDSMPVEISASLRISIKLGTVAPHPCMILLFGDTKGILTIDSDRVIQCDVRG